jgi:hypothetical protein
VRVAPTCLVVIVQTFAGYFSIWSYPENWSVGPASGWFGTVSLDVQVALENEQRSAVPSSDVTTQVCFHVNRRRDLAVSKQNLIRSEASVLPFLFYALLRAILSSTPSLPEAAGQGAYSYCLCPLSVLGDPLASLSAWQHPSMCNSGCSSTSEARHR